jgi:hypothetical protein
VDGVNDVDDGAVLLRENNEPKKPAIPPVPPVFVPPNVPAFVRDDFDDDEEESVSRGSVVIEDGNG